MTNIEAMYRVNTMLYELADLISARLAVETNAGEKEHLERLHKWLDANLATTSLLLGMAAGAMSPDAAIRRFQ